MKKDELARLQLEGVREQWASMHRIVIDLHKLWLKSQLIEFAYRICVLIVGTIFAYLGYRLFLAGFTEVSALSAKGGTVSISFDKAAPGVFFAFFGTVLIIVGIFRLLPLPQSAQQPSVEMPSFSAPSLGEEAVDAQPDRSVPAEQNPPGRLA